jgi:hypothetical protein
MPTARLFSAYPMSTTCVCLPGAQNRRHSTSTRNAISRSASTRFHALVWKPCCVSLKTPNRALCP